METSVFTDRSKKPDDKRLVKTIGKSGTHWTAIKAHISKKHGEPLEQWKYYGPKAGWVLKVLLKKRNLFFLTPLKGYFRVAFVFRDKAATAVEKSRLPAAIRNELKEARRYAEGRALRLEVKSPKDATHVRKLVDIKIAN
jgi:hypothetical protein